MNSRVRGPLRLVRGQLIAEHCLAAGGEELLDHLFAGLLRIVRDGVGDQPDFAAAFQQAHDGALHAVLGQHAVDAALVDVE